VDRELARQLIINAIAEDLADRLLALPRDKFVIELQRGCAPMHEASDFDLVEQARGLWSGHPYWPQAYRDVGQAVEWLFENVVDPECRERRAAARALFPDEAVQARDNLPF